MNKMNTHWSKICADLCNREQIRGSIGLLGEKILHAGLKLYFEPNSDFHEVKVSGFVADICNAEGIIEIQTRSLGKLKRKLEVFLQNMPVTIVYPIAHTNTCAGWTKRQVLLQAGGNLPKQAVLGIYSGNCIHCGLF